MGRTPCDLSTMFAVWAAVGYFSRTAEEGASELMRRKVAYALRSSSQNVSHTYVYLHASLRNLRTSAGILGPTYDLPRSR